MFCFAGLGSILFLLLTSWNIQIVTKTQLNPSLDTYKNLQILYSKTLECPCSNIIIPYRTFLSLSPILHEVCSSDFVTDQWISLLEKSTTGYNFPDWRNTAPSQFHFLSDLCKLANTTIEEAVQRFFLQSFIASIVLTETDFNAQLNATLHQFFRSTIVYFGLLIKTVRIFTQVDQPYFGPILSNGLNAGEDSLIGTFTTDDVNNLRGSQVFIH